MSKDALAPFAAQKYINLESYRKNGQPVRTPVWFAEADGTFYVYSLADAYKVKRIRNNSRVRVAPCDMRGNPKGQWVEGIARVVEQEEASRGHELLNKKYGLIKKIGNFFSRLRNKKHAVIAIELE
jgi:uncharacterized protein